MNLLFVRAVPKYCPSSLCRGVDMETVVGAVAGGSSPAVKRHVSTAGPPAMSRAGLEKSSFRVDMYRS